MKNTLTMIVSFALLLSACSLKKTAEDTEKATKEMNQTTKEMKDNTKDLKGTSNDLRERTESLESEMTYKESHAMMSEHLDRLFQESARDHRNFVSSTWQFFFGNNEDPDLFAEAGFVVYSMFFQFWKGQNGEDLAELDQRLEVGLELLFDRLFKHVPRDGQVDVLRPNASYKGVAALGAKLDLVHDRYLAGLKRRGLPRMTLYDYIIEALRHRADHQRTEPTPLAAAKILHWEPEAVYTLQLRHNILPVMVMARITDFQDRKDLGRLWMWWKGQKIDLSHANPEAIKEWTSWLNKASQTRRDLRAVGIEPQYNRVLKDMVAGVDFGQSALIANTQPDEKQMLLRDLAVAYERVVHEATPAPPADEPAPDFDNLGLPFP